MTGIVAVMLLGALLRALIVTLVLSRALLWGLRAWDGGTKRLLTVHALALIGAIFTCLDQLKQGLPGLVSVLVLYVPMQLLWLAFDLVRHRRRRAD